MTRRSLRFRLLLAATLSIGLALLTAGLGLTTLFERHVQRWVEDQLDATLVLILGHLELTPDGRIRFDLPLADPRFQTPLSGLYWQIRDEDRPTLLRSRSLWDGVLDLPADTLPDGERHRHEQLGPAGEPLLVLERQVVLQPDDPSHKQARRLRVAVAIDRRELARANHAFAADMLPYLILLGVVLVLAAWVQVQVGLAPLDAVRQGVRAVRSGAAGRLPTDYPDEVLPLAEEVNALLDAQDGAIERARAWTADLAHGLKTPLVVLAADAARLRETGHPELADDLDTLAQTMRRRVDRELIRARVRARVGAGQEAGPVRGAADPEADLESTLRRVIRALERTPNGSRLQWDTDCPASLAISILPEDLTELLGNCLENAANWAAGRVGVRVECGERVLVRIEDDGPGVPAEVLKDLGQRGLRLDERTQGFGLGLAIAQDICEAYGSDLAFDRAALGGLRVSLRLPRGRVLNDSGRRGAQRPGVRGTISKASLVQPHFPGVVYMSAFPLSYRVVGDDDYMLEINIDPAGAFVVNSGEHTSHEPRAGTLTSEQRERLLKVLGGLGNAREHPAPEGAPGFMAELTLGEGGAARTFRFWEGALDQEPDLKVVVRELELI
jgi:signal transduction histidine kinase